MVFCTEKSLTYLNRLGYNVVRLPRKGIEPLDVLGRNGNSLERLGRLDQLWTSAKPVPRVGEPQPATSVDGQQTSQLSITMAVTLLKRILEAIGAASPEVSFAYQNAKRIQIRNVPHKQGM